MGGLASRAEAQTVVFSVKGTGEDKTTTGGITTDDNWRLVAMPTYVCTGATPTNCATAPVLNPTPGAPTPVYISPSVPSPWITNVSGTNGITIPGLGGGTYDWITYATYPNQFGAEGILDNSLSYFNRPGSQLSIATADNLNEFSGNYSYIMATEFTAIAGTYKLNFDASADNQFQLYLVPGALSDVQISRTGSFTPQQPGIEGATLLAQNKANTAGQFRDVWTEANSDDVQFEVTFQAGTYTLLYRATDNYSGNTTSGFTYGFTGAFVGATFFTEPNSAVPGPLPIFGAASAFAASRRMRRRIQQSRDLAAEKHKP